MSIIKQSQQQEKDEPLIFKNIPPSVSLLPDHFDEIDIKFHEIEEQTIPLQKCTNHHNDSETTHDDHGIPKKSLPCYSLCPHCRLQCNNEQGLLRHIAEVHNRACHLHCHRCTTSYDGVYSDVDLEIHMVQDHGSAVYKCNLCLFVSFDLHEFANHFTENHVDLGEDAFYKLLRCIELPLCSCLLQAFQRKFPSANSVACSSNFSHLGKITDDDQCFYKNVSAENTAESSTVESGNFILHPTMQKGKSVSDEVMKETNAIIDNETEIVQIGPVLQQQSTCATAIINNDIEIVKISPVSQQQSTHAESVISNMCVGSSAINAQNRVQLNYLPCISKHVMKVNKRLLPPTANRTKENLRTVSLSHQKYTILASTLEKRKAVNNFVAKIVANEQSMLQQNAKRCMPVDSNLNTSKKIKLISHSPTVGGLDQDVQFVSEKRSDQHEITDVASTKALSNFTQEAQTTDTEMLIASEKPRTFINKGHTTSCDIFGLSNTQRFLASSHISNLTRARSLSPHRCDKINVIFRSNTCEDNKNLKYNKKLILAHREDAFDCSYSCIKFALLDRYISVDEILEKTRNEVQHAIYKEVKKKPYIRIKISLKSHMSQLHVAGMKIRKSFYVSSNYYFFDFLNIGKVLDAAANELVQQFEKSKLNGWSLDFFTNITVYLLQSTCKLNAGRFGSYVPWPLKVFGARAILNIRTDKDCVELTMIAFFLNKRDKEMKKLKCNNANYYYKSRDKFFKFPRDVKTPVSVQDFSRIERATNTSLFLFHLNERSSGMYDITLIRRGCSGVSEDRTIHMIKICNSDHVALITDFHKLCRALMRYEVTKKKSHFCRFCFQGLCETKYLKHIEMCAQSEFVQDVLMPKPGEVLSFKNVMAVNNTGYVAYLTSASVSKTWRDTDGYVHTERQLCAYTYCIVTKSGKIIRKRSEVGPDEELATDCLVNLCMDYNKLVDQLDDSAHSELVLTKEDSVRYCETTRCQGCYKKFDKNTKKRPFYNNLKSGINENKKVVEGNYIAAMCSSCRASTLEKKQSLPVICWCSQSNDFSLLMKNWDRQRLEMPVITSNPDDEVLSFTVQLKLQNRDDVQHRVQLIDSKNFMLGSLECCLQELLQSGCEMSYLKTHLQKKGYNDETAALAMQQGMFPWKYLNSFDKLSEQNLPPRYYFNKQDGSVISAEEYLHSERLWQVTDCKSLKNYLKFHLSVQLQLVTEVFQSFRKTVVQDYRLDPACFNSLPLLSMDIALYKKALEITLLHDEEMLNLFEKNIREGLVSVVKPFVTYNNKYSPEFKENEPKLSGLLLRFNSIHETVLSSKLPYGGITVLTKDEVDKFDIIKERCDGECTYALEIDYTIPDEVKRRTDDLPLGVARKAPQLDDMSPFTCHLLQAVSVGRRQRCEKLVISHEDQQHYLISLELLQLLVCLGLEVKKVHKIIRFKQKYCFKEFIAKNLEKEKCSINWHKSDIFRRMSECVFDAVSYNAKNSEEICSIFDHESAFLRAVARPFFRRCYKQSETQAMVVCGKEDIYQGHPTYIGFFLQEKIRYMIYHFFYNVLRKCYADDVTLVCCHTDTMLLSFKNVDDVFKEMKKSPLKDHLDTSNFSAVHPLYSVEREGVFGMLKSVTSQQHLQEVVAFQPVLCSIRLSDTSTVNVSDKTKSFCVGLNHEYMKNIHMKLKNVPQLFNSVNVKVESNVETDTQLYAQLDLLPKLDDRRYYVDADKTLAYGHPDIPEKVAEEVVDLIDSD